MGNVLGGVIQLLMSGLMNSQPDCHGGPDSGVVSKGKGSGGRSFCGVSNPMLQSRSCTAEREVGHCTNKVLKRGVFYGLLHALEVGFDGLFLVEEEPCGAVRC
ncbi:hydroxymethylglutaryl-CoA synthase [Bifidobacterium adolescentis ATCC 15703]|uniref:Hydroxymethylglutaryl-CoA synthase n=1 Tax=Bifidobacterium adolescentis (strain ATCC 15703 / DSM 20083 / NCTC 11814 / E194a) TaxID=367928 RepID=A1A360_BIFAA|nr:hydroxymethylglutaryl-CoA synthase [Bifidobacterium adolescentis ATCC 15703]